MLITLCLECRTIMGVQYFAAILNAECLFISMHNIHPRILIVEGGALGRWFSLGAKYSYAGASGV